VSITFSFKHLHKLKKIVGNISQITTGEAAFAKDMADPARNTAEWLPCFDTWQLPHAILYHGKKYDMCSRPCDMVDSFSCVFSRRLVE
jgi:hypothetical protein